MGQITTERQILKIKMNNIKVFILVSFGTYNSALMKGDSL